jgi:hypothetical protein
MYDVAEDIEVEAHHSEGYVQLDRFTGVMRSFTATARPQDGVEVVLEIEVDESGHPHCRQAKIVADDVTGELIRSVPIARFVAAAMRAPFIYFKLGERTELPTLSEQADFYQRYVMGARQPQRGQPLTDEELLTVAELYRAAEHRGDPPVRTIVDQLRVPRGTAQRWVNKARERNLLEASPRSTKGKS